MTFEEFSELSGDLSDVLVEPRPQDIACILYTSGTSGPSKGVLMPHAHCYLFGDGMVRTMRMTAQDCQYVCMPLFHAMGLLLQVLSALIAGSRVYCVERFSPNRWLEDGQQVTVGNQTLEVLHCPGHTPGHVVFYHKESGLALVGDVLFHGSIGRTDFPKGDHATLIRSIREQLFPLGDEVAFIPGHGPMSTFGRERATNPFVSDHRG